MIGRAPEMEKLYRFISKAANSLHPVLILGESGTGKELVARSIHYNGPNKNKKFHPRRLRRDHADTDRERIVWSRERRVHRGRSNQRRVIGRRRRRNRVPRRDRRTANRLQAKLLRAIQEKEIRPVGSTRRLPIDVRIFAATNRDLDVAVQNGTFRRDLYFRLNVLALRVPPLRERKQDIPRL